MTHRSKTLRTISELREAGLVAAGDVARLHDVAKRYAVAITPHVANLIERGTANDPIARQFVPDTRELTHAPEERADPLGEDARSPVPGLVHRYADRVLLKLTHVCPVYCRFCFRREVVGPGGPQALTDDALDAAISYIARHPEIWEVILTGGDPLMLSARRVADVTARLAGISTVQVMRWHSRVPVVDPDRITTRVVEALQSPGRAVYLAIHINHPRELTPSVRAVLARLNDAGIVLISQTVLLKGVNDDADVLAALFRGLVAARVKPYYLHHPDLAPGTAHFRLAVEEGQAIVRDLRGRVSGLAQPTYVLDIPGGYGKVPIGPGYLDEDGRLVVDPSGGLHPYPDRG